jgi:hypothetical protein
MSYEHESPTDNQKEKIKEILKPYTELVKEKNALAVRLRNMLQSDLIDEIFKVRFPEIVNLPEEKDARLETIHKILSKTQWISKRSGDNYDFSGSYHTKIDNVLTNHLQWRLLELQIEYLNLVDEIKEEKKSSSMKKSVKRRRTK